MVITIFYSFCHTLTWISHGCTCVPHPEPSLPPPSPTHPSGLSQCTNPENPVLFIKPGLAIYFTYGNIHVSMLFSQIIPSLPSSTESKSLFLHPCLFCCLAYKVIITIFLNRQTFLDKVMSLFFNMLSRLVIAFLSRSKGLLISRLQSPSAVIL